VPTLETRYDYRCFTHHLGSVGGNFGTTCKFTLIVQVNKRWNTFIQNEAVHGEYMFFMTRLVMDIPKHTFLTVILMLLVLYETTGIIL
jgi:hypothetical protein